MSNVIMMRKSCLTGKVVWLYQGPSIEAARMAYSRACKREIARVKQWSKIAARRKSNIMRLLSECMSNLPINAELTEEQENSACHIRDVGMQSYSCDRAFYEHILAERRMRRKKLDLRDNIIRM